MTSSSLALLEVMPGGESLLIRVPASTAGPAQADARWACARVLREANPLSLRTESAWIAATPISIAGQTSGGLVIVRDFSLGNFDSTDIGRANILADQIALVADRLTGPRTLADEVAALQLRRVHEALTKHDWNISAVSRELGVGRAFVYAILQRRKGA